MTIVDYSAKAIRLTEKLMNDPKISEENKILLTRFLKIYSVSEARRTIFMERIAEFLRHTKDARKDIHDEEQMADLFNRLKRGQAIATYATSLGVAKRFARWINDGVLPKAIAQISSPGRSQVRRDLDPSDMWTWEDGLEAVRTQYSIQVKAMFLMQLDAGFRPSELLDLRFGDIELRGDLAIARVKKGKTGPRNVVMYRCVSILTQWVQSHPTQKKDDPLWILEHADKSHGADKRNQKSRLVPFSYAAVCKRFKKIRDWSEIDKPHDLYCLRHSSCVLDKKDNLPLDSAAERHGHSVKFFVEVYGRLTIEDTLNRFRLHYGLQNSRGDTAKPGPHSPRSLAAPRVPLNTLPQSAYIQQSDSDGDRARFR